MFGISITKLVVLALAIYGAWQLFRWIERRGITDQRRADAPPPAQQTYAESEQKDDGAVEMEQDSETGVWRPKR